MWWLQQVFQIICNDYQCQAYKLMFLSMGDIFVSSKTWGSNFWKSCQYKISVLWQRWSQIAVLARCFFNWKSFGTFSKLKQQLNFITTKHCFLKKQIFNQDFKFKKVKNDKINPRDLTTGLAMDSQFLDKLKTLIQSSCYIKALLGQ